MDELECDESLGGVQGASSIVGMETEPYQEKMLLASALMTLSPSLVTPDPRGVLPGGMNSPTLGLPSLPGSIWNSPVKKIQGTPMGPTLNVGNKGPKMTDQSPMPLPASPYLTWGGSLSPLGSLGMVSSHTPVDPLRRGGVGPGVHLGSMPSMPSSSSASSSAASHPHPPGTPSTASWYTGAYTPSSSAVATSADKHSHGKAAAPNHISLSSHPSSSATASPPHSSASSHASSAASSSYAHPSSTGGVRGQPRHDHPSSSVKAELGQNSDGRGGSSPLRPSDINAFVGSPLLRMPPQSSHQPAGIGFASPGYEFASDKDTRRRTKSVITPDSRRRAPVSNERIFQENSPTPTWVSVKVFGSSPHSDLTSLSVPRKSVEFSHAMRTINSKFKDKMPTRRSVKVGDLNSAAQPQIKGRANSPYRYPYADDGDDDFLPSPPTAKFRASGSTDSSADAVKQADLYLDTANMADGLTPANQGARRSTTGQQRPGGGGGQHNKNSKADLNRRKPCNCKNSKCLKLYCDCFARGEFCKDCNCRECHNNENHEEERQAAIKATLDKNPNAFQAKISKATGNAEHSSGCHCKKSKCLKKYCECFEAAVFCGDKCKCLDCENYEGSVALMQRKAKMKDGRKITHAAGSSSATAASAMMRAPPAPPAASIVSKMDAPELAAPVPGLDAHSDGLAPMELDHDKLAMEKPLVQRTTRSSDRGRAKVAEKAVAVSEVAVGAVAVVGTGPAEAAPSKIESSPPGEQSEASTPGSERRVRLRGAPALQQANGAAGAKRSGSPRRSPYGRRYDAIAGSSSNLTRALPFPSPAKSRRRGEVGLPTGREAVTCILDCSETTKPLIISIFQGLSDADLGSASLVSKAWLDAAFDESMWEYPGDSPLKAQGAALKATL